MCLCGDKQPLVPPLSRRAPRGGKKAWSPCQETWAAPQRCPLAIWHQFSVQQEREGIEAVIHKVLVPLAELWPG